MFRAVSSGLLAATTIVLSGCAGVPELDFKNPITVAHIIDRIQCEAYNASVRFPKFRKDKWVGVADLYLQVDDSAGLSPSLTYIEPLAAAGTQWTIGASANFKRSRQRIYNESIKIEMAKLDGRTCENAVVAYDLTGDLGIEETLFIAAHSFSDDEDHVAFSDKEAIGQTLQFVLTKNIAGGPTWALKHFIGGGPLLGGERIDTHKLIVSFAPGEQKKKIVTAQGVKTIVTGGGGGSAASINNQKLLLQSLPSFQFLGR